MAEEKSKVTPWVRWEDVTISANGFQNTDQSRFRNESDADVLVSRFLFDSLGNTGLELRFGKRGDPLYLDDFVDARALNNAEYMNQVTDSSWMLWRLDQPFFLAPRQGFTITLQDTVVGGARYANVLLIGFDLKTHEPIVLAERVTIPDGGQAEANPQSKQKHPVLITAVQIYLEETGTAALMRGLKVKVEGGAMPAWSKDAVPASVCFPERNGAAQVFKPANPVILKPGQTFDFEVRDTSGSSNEVYIGVVGYRLDRRG